MYDILSKHYNRLFPDHPALGQFIVQYVAKDKLAYDLGCGTGRLSALVSSLGMQVIGYDLDRSMVEEAKCAYPDINFRVLDMTDVPDSRKVHLVTCFGNTVVHLSPERLGMFVSKLKKILHKEGFVVIQMLNYDRIVRNGITELPPIETDGITFERRYAYLPDRLVFQVRLTLSDGTVLSDQTDLWPYTLHDMESVLDRHRFQHHAYGSLAHKPFAGNDYYLYLVIHH
jgi:SAM-dependent methyltransferase